MPAKPSLNGFSRLRARFQNRFPSGSFGRNVLTMMSGTFIAQAVPLAVSPILTRLYTPDEFGLFFVYMSLASIVTVLATGRYELAVMLPEKDDDAANLVALALVSVSLTCVLLFLVNWLFNKPMARLLGNPAVSPWLYLAPFTVFVAAVYEVLYYWANRKKQFKRLAVTKVTVASATAGVNLAMGAARLGAGGLIVGGVAGQGIATGVLAGQIWTEDRRMLGKISKSAIRNAARRYKKFPQFSLPADSINVASNMIPAVLLSHFFGGMTAGYFFLTQRVLGAPLSLVARSFQDVFKQQASHDYAQFGNCKRTYLKTFKSLCLLAGIPLALFLLAAPWLFVFIFGTNWREAGIYAQLLSVMFFFRFIASPLSYVLYIAEKQNYDLVWQIGLFLATAASLLAGAYFDSARIGILCYSASYSLMYIVYLFLSYRFACGHNRPGGESKTAERS